MQYRDRNKPPVTAEPQFDEFPDELRALKQWVMWRYVWKWKDEEETSGAWAKLPMQPNGEAASSMDASTWSTFDSVILAFNQRVGYFSGIGFVFTRESGYVGIDIDNAVEWTEIDGVKCPVFGDWIKRTIAKIGETYVEYSPSRTGVHLIVKANPKQAVKFTEGGFEIYAEGRYFTMTGDAIENAPIADATEAIDEIVDALLGTRSQPATETTKKDVPISYLSIEERLDIACNHASNSAAIKKLFEGDFSDYKNGENDGRSEADMALCRYLAFYSEGNPTLLMEMMRASKMPRPKWEKHYGDGTTYLSRLVKQVLSTERNFIEPAKSFLNAGKPATTGNERSSRRYRLQELGEAALKYRNDPHARGIECGSIFYDLDQIYRPRRKLMTVVVGEPGSGKALALDTKLPTPTGWTTMGDVQVGDQLFDERGQVCTVTATTPVMLDRRCYRVVFSDGSEIVADAEHLWLTRDERARRSAYRREGKGKNTIQPSVVTTQQIKETLHSGTQRRKNHSIVIAEAIQLPPKELPIDPYVLGAWLGDGHSADGRFTNNDPPVAEEIRRLGYDIQKRPEPFLYQILGLKVQLRKIGVLNNKHIPECYLRGSIEQRLSILQGLMDTDGYISEKGACEYVTVRESLAIGVKDLLCGLGIPAQIVAGRAKLYGRDCGPKYRIRFTTNMPVFRLQRRKERLPNMMTYKKRRVINEVIEVDSVPVRCIQVDSPSHLYLASENYIPTHNTTLILNYLYHLAMANQLHVGFVSFENDPVDLTHSLVQAHLKKPTYTEFDDCCTEEEFRQALDEMGKLFTVYDPTWEEQNVAGLSGYWEDSIKAEGLDCIYLDPFTELQPSAQLLGKYTDFASQQLSQFVSFTRSRSLMSWLVCHPTKNFTRKEGLKLWNINGSGDFERKTDFGLVLTRNDGKLEVEVQKVRHWRTGCMGESVAFFYDQRRGVYTPTRPNAKKDRKIAF